MKFCPSCMRPHGERGRACSPECERRIQRALSREAAGRRYRIGRQLDLMQETFTRKRRWRDVAFGRNAAERLREIFGVDVEP